MLAHFSVSNVDPPQRAFLKENAPPGIRVDDASNGIQLTVEFDESEIALVAECLASTILHVRVDSELSTNGGQIPFDAEEIAARLGQLVKDDRRSDAA